MENNESLDILAKTLKTLDSMAFQHDNRMDALEARIDILTEATAKDLDGVFVSLSKIKWITGLHTLAIAAIAGYLVYKEVKNKDE